MTWLLKVVIRKAWEGEINALHCNIWVGSRWERRRNVNGLKIRDYLLPTQGSRYKPALDFCIKLTQNVGRYLYFYCFHFYTRKHMHSSINHKYVRVLSQDGFKERLVAV